MLISYFLRFLTIGIKPIDCPLTHVFLKKNNWRRIKMCGYAKGILASPESALRLSRDSVWNDGEQWSHGGGLTRLPADD
jgi:hypothetical protein